jgi:hypothetical protein
VSFNAMCLFKNLVTNLIIYLIYLPSFLKCGKLWILSRRWLADTAVSMFIKSTSLSKVVGKVGILGANKIPLENNIISGLCGVSA